MRAPAQDPLSPSSPAASLSPRQTPATRQPDPRQAYYARLAEALAQDGFCAGAHLVTKEDIVASAEGALAIARGVLSLAAPSLALFCDPLLRAATKASVVGGDEVERALSPLAPRFVLLAHSSKVGATRVFAALDGDDLKMPEAEALAATLLDTLSSLTGKGITVQMSVSLLFAFFDHSRALGSTHLILDRCFLNKWNRRLNRICIIPIVCDVPARLLWYKKSPTVIPGVATVSKDVLQRALPWPAEAAKTTESARLQLGSQTSFSYRTGS